MKTDLRTILSEALLGKVIQIGKRKPRRVIGVSVEYDDGAAGRVLLDFEEGTGPKLGWFGIETEFEIIEEPAKQKESGE